MVPIQTTSRKLNYIKYLNFIFCDFAMGGAMAPMAPPGSATAGDTNPCDATGVGYRTFKSCPLFHLSTYGNPTHVSEHPHKILMIVLLQYILLNVVSCAL